MAQRDDAAAKQSPVLAQLSLHRFGNSRKGDMDEVRTEADKAMLTLGKRLLDCQEYKAIRKFDYETMGRVRSISIPSLFKAGVYQVKAQAVEKIHDYLTERAATRGSLVAVMCDAYENRVREAEARLGPQFSAEDYPTREGFARTFGMEWRFFTMEAPSKVRGLDPEFVRREQQRLEDMFKAAREEGVALVRAEFQALVDHLIDRLTPDADGQKKRLHATAITRIQDFIRDFDLRNVADDRDVALQIEKAKALLDGVDPQSVRESETAGERLRKAFDAMKRDVDRLVEKAPRRFVDADALAATD